MIDDDTSSWVKYLPFLTFAYRTYDVSGMGLSPYKIMFGRDPKLPIDLYAKEDESWQTRVDRVKYATLHSDRLRIVHDLVREFQSNSNAKAKARYDATHKPVEFALDQLVLVWTPPQVLGSQKLERKFRGPYRVIAKKSDVTYKVKHETSGKEMVVHINRMVEYFQSKHWEAVPDFPSRRKGKNKSRKALLESKSADSGKAKSSTSIPSRSPAH
jgi:hypothetical protein